MGSEKRFDVAKNGHLCLYGIDLIDLCEKNKLDPDFYVKTFHTDRYWSATPKERREEYDWMRRNSSDHDANNDNMWCNNPEETAAFMETVDKPWVAFKVMAAGAINPRVAFSSAYRHGADFIIAGMFDFQVEADVKLAIESLRQCYQAHLQHLVRAKNFGKLGIGPANCGY